MHRNTQYLVLATSLILSACTKAAKVDLPVQTAAKSESAAGGGQLEEKSPAGAVTSSPVSEAAAQPAKLEETIKTRISGEVASQTKSQISFRVGGFVQDLKLKPGEACKKGDVLAVIDGRDFKLALDMAVSQRDLARVALTNASQEYEREVQLKKENVSTEAIFDKQKASYDKSKLDLQLAELRVKQAEQAMQDTRLIAPYDCIVTKQLRNLGESVKSGDVVFELYNTTDIELNFAVPENLAGQIKVGDKLKVSIPTSGYSGNLEVTRLVPLVEQATRTFRVIVKAPEKDARLVPGLYAEAQLQ